MSKPGLNFTHEDYFNQSEKNKARLDTFWTDVINNLKNIYKNKILELVTFNCNYQAEISLYAGCKENNIPVKLWFKECFRSDPGTEWFIKDARNKYFNVFQSYSKNISL